MFSDESIEKLEKSIAKGKPETGPTDLQILPTPRCNATCAFCPLHAMPDPLKELTPRFNTYTKDLAGGLLDRLADDLYRLGGLKRVTITGGEPLLYPFLIPAVFQFKQSFPAAEMTIVTNGIRLGKFAAFFARAGIDRVAVSINAGTRNSYKAQNPGAPPAAIEEVVAGVKVLCEERKKSKAQKPHVDLTSVLTKNNASDVEPLYEIGKRTGVDAVTFIPLMEIRVGGEKVNQNLVVKDDQFKKFLAAIDKYKQKAEKDGFFLGYAGTEDDGGVIDSKGLYNNQPCYAGHAFAAVYPNGDVRPCCHCETIVGNLSENSFGEIWNSKAYTEIREKMAAIAESGGKIDGCQCSECGYTFENKTFLQKLSARQSRK